MRIVRTWTFEDQAIERYPTIPFEVPPGIRGIGVRIEVSGDGVVDLGCEGPDGWRGWSGGARRDFVIFDDDATPGYLPGTIEHGTWRVVLGLHSLPSGTVTVEAEITLDPDEVPDHGPCPEPVIRPAVSHAPDIPAPSGMRWVVGDTHAHSLHSDGKLSLWELANCATSSGLDFLCVTDHNTTSHHAHLEAVGKRHGITLVPGQEVTTHRGHANVFGDVGFIDFRRPAEQWVRQAQERGGWMSINHPVSGDCSWLHPLQQFPPGVELAHSDWWKERISTAALAWAALHPQPFVLVGGGDFHSFDGLCRPGVPATWVAVEELSAEAIIDAFRAGRTAVTLSCEEHNDGVWPMLKDIPMLVRSGTALVASHARGLALVDADGCRQIVADERWTIEAPVGVYRLEDSRRNVMAMCC